MNSSHRGTTVEEQRRRAKQLVSQLDAGELLVLAGLAMGMSRRAIADSISSVSDDVERTLESLMNKIGTRTIADAVRVAILAGASTF